MLQRPLRTGWRSRQQPKPLRDFSPTILLSCQWGGNDPQWGGVYLFYYYWNQFGFNNSVTTTKATPSVTVSDWGGVYKGSAFSATALVKGSNGTFAGTLEGISPTLTYYAGIFPSGSALSGAPINAGTYTVVAAFPGSTDYAAATSSPFTFTIAKATTATTVVPSASISALGQSVTFTATVSVVKPGSGAPAAR